MKKKMDIVVAGHICLDIIPDFGSIRVNRVEDIIQPGRLINVKKATVSSGGPVSNTGFALHKLGMNVGFMAKIGRDNFGNILLDILKNYTDDVSCMSVIPGENTSYSVVLVIPGIDRIFLHNTGTNDTFGYEDIDFEVLKKAKLLHLGYPPLLKRLYENEGAELAKILKKAKSLGLVTSLDMSLPDPQSESGKVNWNSILEKTLPYVDLFHPSIEEALFMVDRNKLNTLRQKYKNENIIDYIEPGEFTLISDIFLNYGAKIVSLKCGHRGFYLRTNVLGCLKKLGSIINADAWSSRELWAPCYRVDEIASATGAGDSSIAGFIAAFLKGKPPEITLKCANAVGAQNLATFDSVSGIRTWNETVRMINNPKLRLGPLKIFSKGWIFNKAEGLWHGPRNKQLK